MAPIVLQWRGDGPPELETNHTRLLGESRGQQNIEASLEAVQLNDHVAKRILQEDDLKHSVTFKNCVFRVSNSLSATKNSGFKSLRLQDFSCS